MADVSLKGVNELMLKSSSSKNNFPEICSVGQKGVHIWLK